MRDLPLNALRAFAAVYETGGVRPAARALQVTHSSVSRHLRELEARIQTPLFDERRGRRSLAFTAEGEALGRTALASLGELEGAVASVREAKRANSVTIATTPSLAVRWLLPRLPSFEAENKWIEVSVVVDQRRRTPIEEGADIGIRMGRGPWRGVVGSPLMDDRLYPVMSTGYWQDVGQPDGRTGRHCRIGPWFLPGGVSRASAEQKGTAPRRCKKGPLGGCGLVPVVHGRAPRATRRALNRLTRRRAREGPVGPRGQAWAGWSVQLAVGV